LAAVVVVGQGAEAPLAPAGPVVVVVLALACQ
jgi:hypothetical protein